MPLAFAADHGVAETIALVVREAVEDIEPQDVPSVVKTIYTGQYLNCVLATLLVYDFRELFLAMLLREV